MTPSFTYSPTEHAVFWGAIKLSPESCEDLLSIFEREGAAKAFNELHDAHLKAGGITRCSSVRRVAA